MVLWVGSKTSPQVLQDLFGVQTPHEIDHRMVRLVRQSFHCHSVYFAYLDGTSEPPFLTLLTSAQYTCAQALRATWSRCQTAYRSSKSRCCGDRAERYAC